jgi:hypothetical protein
MTQLRPAFAILLPLFGSMAHAGPQSVPRAYQADFYLPGCKDFLAGRSNFLSGRCVGAVEVLDDLGFGYQVVFVLQKPPTTLIGCALLPLTLKLDPRE